MNLRSVFLAWFVPVILQGAELSLTTDGKTEYKIVIPAEPTGTDRYAAETLAAYLFQSTGAEFEIVSTANAPRTPALFVGLGVATRKRLRDDPLRGVQDQECVVRSLSQDILLYGKGHRTSLYAVMDFLEIAVGWRWYSFFEKPIVSRHSTLTLRPLHRHRRFDFQRRHLAPRYNAEFFQQHGVNMGWETKLLKRGQSVPEHLRSWLPNANFVHTSFSYIPPTPQDRYAKEFSWQTKHDYFATNPEFFSVNQVGERVPNLQLCFSNRGLRDEFTRQVKRNLAHAGERQIIMVDAADRPGRFCHCEECTALEAKHQTPGGPLFDYVIELANTLKRDHPAARVKTLAYRRSQTQKPPRLPQGDRLPGNLIIDFAPIEDAYFADWSHPDERVQETFRHLEGWAAITAPGNLWAWLYPNPWGSGHVMPVGNVERVVTNLRLMHQIGVRGIFLDHNGVNSRSGWSELQVYLVLKLAQDITADTDALIGEFTDHMYGSAAPLVRRYLADLEAARKSMKTFAPGVTYKSRNYDERTFPYLTPTNIHRWQQSFARMLELTSGSPRPRANVENLRRELDVATLWKWFALKQEFPAAYADHRPVAQRIAAADMAKSSAGIKPVWKLGEGIVADFVTRIEAGGEKPLPEQFAGIPPGRLRSYLPQNSRRGTAPRNIRDPQAAFGLATIVDQPGQPFRCGFAEWKSRTPNHVLRGPDLELNPGDVNPGQYQLHRLGEFNVTTDDSLIWFGRSWATAVAIGSRLHFPGETSRWEAWLNLKFDGESWGGQGSDLVVCDRVILVRKDKKLDSHSLVGRP